MVVIDMNLTPPKIIEKKTCLWAKGLFGLSKDFKPKRRINIWKESKEIRDFVKVEDGGVHHKKYDVCCTKQRIKIPKVTWTSSILRRRSTCWTSFSKTFLMKNDMKVEMSNETPKILFPFNGVVNWEGVLKFGGRPKGDHAMHFWGWVKKPITWNLI